MTTSQQSHWSCSGWGTTSYGGSGSDVLLEVSVPVVNHTTCVDTMGAGITEGMICAGGEEGKDGCQVSHTTYINIMLR